MKRIKPQWFLPPKFHSGYKYPPTEFVHTLLVTQGLLEVSNGVVKKVRELLSQNDSDPIHTISIVLGVLDLLQFIPFRRWVSGSARFGPPP